MVDSYETERMGEAGETQTLEVDELTDEMAEYRCRPHEGQMRGEIEARSTENG
ncbi:plastocyanin/azurin family copper-binding protein [Halobiforma nitratireducens]|uniref:Blue (Type 1) copper domain protein n=1 Tax=Halobiforma nitratireducens JCM 10879 TaxID=1227454 RepID=M0MBH4_9EURY|nr:plastocyanin/azurin family copper-binding protein [Halobiforma nitratireducens]EMA41755.1 blue (type 1) copper domain protein [Halobiforma nitratireducens JCM 10879]